MERARKGAMVVIAVLLALAPGSAQAGNGDDPEIPDPAGDAYTVDLTQSPEADITAVWFDTTRDEHGDVTALNVNLRTVEPVEDEEGVGFAVFWDAQEREDLCSNQLSWDVLPERYGGTTSSFLTSCSETGPVTLEDILTLDILRYDDQREAGLMIEGSVYRLSIDVSDLPEPSRALHGEGDLLTGIYATSYALYDDLSVGTSGTCTDVAPADGCWLGLFGSPDWTGRYIIGS